MTKTALNQSDIDKMVEQVIHMKGVRLAESEVYEKRISACRNCEKLEYGSTCMLCGCVVEVRCRLKDSKCPYPKQSKWQ